MNILGLIRFFSFSLQIVSYDEDIYLCLADILTFRCKLRYVIGKLLQKFLNIYIDVSLHKHDLSLLIQYSAAISHTWLYFKKSSVPCPYPLALLALSSLESFIGFSFANWTSTTQRCSSVLISDTCFCRVEVKCPLVEKHRRIQFGCLSVPVRLRNFYIWQLEFDTSARSSMCFVSPLRFSLHSHAYEKGRFWILYAKAQFKDERQWLLRVYLLWLPSTNFFQFSMKRPLVSETTRNKTHTLRLTFFHGLATPRSSAACDHSLVHVACIFTKHFIWHLSLHTLMLMTSHRLRNIEWYCLPSRC